MKRRVSRTHSSERNNFLKNARRFSAFKTSPFSLGTVARNNSSPNQFILPASANIGISFNVTSAAGEVTVSHKTRTLTFPSSSANKIHRLGYFEKSEKLIPRSSIPGTMTLYFFDQDFLPSAIATGVFI